MGLINKYGEITVTALLEATERLLDCVMKSLIGRLCMGTLLYADAVINICEEVRRIRPLLLLPEMRNVPRRILRCLLLCRARLLLYYRMYGVTLLLIGICM